MRIDESMAIHSAPPPHAGNVTDRVRVLLFHLVGLTITAGLFVAYGGLQALTSLGLTGSTTGVVTVAQPSGQSLLASDLFVTCNTTVVYSVNGVVAQAHALLLAPCPQPGSSLPLAYDIADTSQATVLVGATQWCFIGLFGLAAVVSLYYTVADQIFRKRNADRSAARDTRARARKHLQRLAIDKHMAVDYAIAYHRKN